MLIWDGGGTSQQGNIDKTYINIMDSPSARAHVFLLLLGVDCTHSYSGRLRLHAPLFSLLLMVHFSSQQEAAPQAHRGSCLSSASAPLLTAPRMRPLELTLFCANTCCRKGLPLCTACICLVGWDLRPLLTLSLPHSLGLGFPLTLKDLRLHFGFLLGHAPLQPPHSSGFSLLSHDSLPLHLGWAICTVGDIFLFPPLSSASSLGSATLLHFLSDTRRHIFTQDCTFSHFASHLSHSLFLHSALRHSHLFPLLPPALHCTASRALSFARGTLWDHCRPAVALPAAGLSWLSQS